MARVRRVVSPGYAMYRLTFDLVSFESLDVRQARIVVTHMVNALVAANEGWLRKNRVVPLYDSGVRYVRDTEPEWQWRDIPAVLAHGEADCKALAAWRVAELRADGLGAAPIVNYSPADGFHVIVQSSRGREDPSAQLLRRAS